jgi:hypothetical protein
MSSLRDLYNLPERPPVPYRIWLLTLTVLAISLGLWLVFGDSTITVVLLFVAVVATLSVGLAHILRSPELEEPPPLDPVPPPSLRPPEP